MTVPAERTCKSGARCRAISASGSGGIGDHEKCCARRCRLHTWNDVGIYPGVDRDEAATSLRIAAVRGSAVLLVDAGVDDDELGTSEIVIPAGPDGCERVES